MKKLFLAALLLALPAMANEAPKPAAPAPEKTAAAPVAPEKTVTMADGKEYTAAQILGFFKDEQDRIADLTNQRDRLAGQVLDLTAALQKAQAAKK